jgi:FlaA1/EpsC-like NDP-sugar epimerase
VPDGRVEGDVTEDVGRGWSGTTVTVTGGEGFIGSTLVERLVREGAS